MLRPAYAVQKPHPVPLGAICALRYRELSEPNKHLRRLYDKLGVTSRQEAVAAARQFDRR